MVVRFLCAFAIFLLPAWAGAISILIPKRPDLRPLEIARQEYETVLRGDAAETTMRVVFRNPHGFDLEGTFLMPVPRDTVVTRFAMTMNGKEVEAAVLEREEARRIYTDIVRRMRDPGLMEWVDERTFRVDVFPIPANGEMPIVATMVQPLARMGDYRAFEFSDARADSTVPVAETKFSLRIESDEPIANVWSPTHEISVDYGKERREAKIAPKSFKAGAISVCYSTEGGGAPLAFSAYRPRKDKPGWFLLMAQPSDAAAKETAVPYVATFVLDTSGSMNEDGKIDQAKSALAQCLGALREKDRFNIVTFATGVQKFAAEPREATKENLAEARKFVDALRAQGGTNIAGALDAALAQDTGDALHQVVLVTDGRPTVGATEVSQILHAVGDRDAKPRRIFAFGVGYDVNAHLLDALAEETRAVSDYAIPGEDIETKVAGFFDAIAAPVATDVEIAVDGVRASDIHPSPMPDLFAGRATLVAGRYDKAGKATIKLSGKSGDGKFERSIDVEFPEKTGEGHRHVATLWAGRRIAFLIDEMRRNGETTELRDEAVALSKQYGIPTPWTSFLATDDGESDRRVASPPPIYVEPNPINPRPRPIPLPGDRPRPMRGPAMHDAATFDPAAKTTSRGDIARESGEGAVALSMQRNAYKAATYADAVVAENPAPAEARTVAGRRFAKVGGAWREESMPSDCAVEKVEYLSDAWFALHEAAPEIREFLELGERVVFTFGSVCVEIGPAGMSAADDGKALAKRAAK